MILNRNSYNFVYSDEALLKKHLVPKLFHLALYSHNKYEAWRFGKVSYLESVCTVNLRKLSFIMHQIRLYAQKQHLKPSFCYYKQWGVQKKNGQGHKPAIPLRFSKSGKPEIEREYATHYVDAERTAQLKVKKQNSDVTVEQS